MKDSSLVKIKKAVGRVQLKNVPVAPYIGNYGARLTGVPLSNYCRDGKIMGADILELDYKVRLKTASDLVGSCVCLMGNLDPTRVLLQGTPGIVLEEAGKCIEDTGMSCGFILGTGCEVAVDTPLENMRAMLRAARERQQN